jgi:cysteinyl-tRNA synthetase
VTKHLGFQVDVACGGIDNLVRHHDYTLAVAEAVSGEPFSRYWLHGGHLFVNGKKMSKSTGYVYYTSDILQKGFSGEQLRFFLTYGPYRKKLNFTLEKLAETSRKLDSFRSMVTDLEKQKSANSENENEGVKGEVVSVFEKGMNNDLDVKTAFDCVYETVCELHKKRETLSFKDLKNVTSDLRRIDSVLQFISE